MISAIYLSVFFVTIALLSAGSPAQAPMTWNRVATTGPSARTGHAMAYDSTRQKTVLFGGYDGTNFLSDTWEWNGLIWTLVSLSGPSPRTEHAMTYHDGRGTIILTGGFCSSGGPGPYLSDAWEWNGSAWASIGIPSPQGYPPGRYGHQIAYDAARAKLFLYGGSGYGSAGSPPAVYYDFWEWDGSYWSQQIQGYSSPQIDHSFTYFPPLGCTVHFGGYSGYGYNNNIALWNGSTWNFLSSSNPLPQVRARHSTTYDSARGTLVVFGGLNNNSSFSDTWIWNSTGWHLSNSQGPTARYDHAMSYDSHRGHHVLFGGFTNGGRVADTWEYATTWLSASIQSTGSGCAGSSGVPSLAVLSGSPPRLGNNLQLQVGTLPPVATVCVPFYGFNNQSFNSIPLPASLAPYGMPGCTIYSDVAYTAFVFGFGGSAAWSLQIPSSAAFAGTHVYLQSLVFDPLAPNPAGVVTTNALDALIGY